MKDKIIWIEFLKKSDKTKAIKKFINDKFSENK